jgi:selenide,water dikinase
MEVESLPVLTGARALAEAGVSTGGGRRNREYAGPHVESRAGAAWETLAYDPQTAGGLLVSLPVERAAVLEAAFTAAGLDLFRIGRVEAGSGVVLS